MRVIAGTAKGRIIKSPAHTGVRPTSDKIKGAVFNIIGPYLDKKTFLDLFAGSGSMGIEALSRGASSSFFIEKNMNCVKIIKENLKITGFSSKAKIFKIDVVKGLKILHKNELVFDYIFMDPPYFKPFYLPVLKDIAEKHLLKEDGCLMVEHFKDIILPEKINPLTMKCIRKYGDTLVSFYTC